MINPGYYFISHGDKLVQQLPPINTNRVLIIGTAVDGPVNVPTQVTDQASFAALFGPGAYSGNYTDPNGLTTGKQNGATLTRGVDLAFKAGGQDIWVVRATGTKATASNTFGSMLDVQPIYAGSIYNQVTFAIASGTGSASGSMVVNLNQPTSKGGNLPTLLVPKTASISDFINAINGLSSNKTIVINPDTYFSTLTNAVSSLTPGTCTFSGGANETDAVGEALYNNKALYYTRLTTTDNGTFDSIKGSGFLFHATVLTGLYIDDEVVSGDPTTSVYGAFAYFLEQQSETVLPCIGVLATRPTYYRDPAKYLTYIKNSLLTTAPAYYNSSLKWINAGPFLADGLLYTDPSGRVIDLGGRICVTAGAEFIWNHPDVGNYTDSFHVWLATQVVTTPPENSVSNTPITGSVAYTAVVPLTYAANLAAGIGSNFTSNITGAGAYVTCRKDPAGSNSLVVYDDPTTAARNDPFRQLQWTVLINNIHSDVYNQLLSYIGKPNTPSMRASASARVTAILEGYNKSGGLLGGQGTGYTFSLTSSGPDQDTGIIRVQMTLLPSRAIRAIVSTVNVSRNS